MSSDYHCFDVFIRTERDKILLSQSLSIELLNEFMTSKKLNPVSEFLSNQFNWLHTIPPLSQFEPTLPKSQITKQTSKQTFTLVNGNRYQRWWWWCFLPSSQFSFSMISQKGQKKSRNRRIGKIPKASCTHLSSEQHGMLKNINTRSPTTCTSISLLYRQNMI